MVTLILKLTLYQTNCYGRGNHVTRNEIIFADLNDQFLLGTLRFVNKSALASSLKFPIMK